jgi:hypothetical protein
VPLVENLLLLWNMAHHNHIPRSLYTFVSQKMPSVKYTNYHNYLWSASGCVFVHFFLIVILFFKWLYHLLGVEFDKTNTSNESKMVKIVGNRSNLVENESKIGWIGQKNNSRCQSVCWGWIKNILQLLAWWLSSVQIIARLHSLESQLMA